MIVQRVYTERFGLRQVRIWRDEADMRQRRQTPAAYIAVQEDEGPVIQLRLPDGDWVTPGELAGLRALLERAELLVEEARAWGEPWSAWRGQEAFVSAVEEVRA